MPSDTRYSRLFETIERVISWLWRLRAQGAWAGVRANEPNGDVTRHGLQLESSREAKRRQELSNLAATVGEKQTYEGTALANQARLQQAQANLDQARVNLERTEIRSQVNGWVTNLLAQLGDYANVGQNLISVVDADSFWVDGYFEETNLEPIQVGDPASIKLMGYKQIVRGHVGSIARGINVANAQPNGQGLAQVNPIFTWVRLAQRIPVRIQIDHVPEGVVLSAGMTATVQIDPRPPAK
jgi:multidrug resistance efflux pump